MRLARDPPEHGAARLTVIELVIAMALLGS